MIANIDSWSPGPCPNIRLELIEPLESDVPSRPPGGPAIPLRHRYACPLSAAMALSNSLLPGKRRACSPRPVARPSGCASPFASACHAPLPSDCSSVVYVYIINIYRSSPAQLDHPLPRARNIDHNGHSMSENRATWTQNCPLLTAKNASAESGIARQNSTKSNISTFPSQIASTSPRSPCSLCSFWPFICPPRLQKSTQWLKPSAPLPTYSEPRGGARPRLSRPRRAMAA